MEHHIVISADTHCGAELRDYRPCLESKYHRDFDEWADGVERAQQAAAAAFEGRKSPRNVGVDGDPATDGDRNWSMERRLREQNADGVVAEVMFPNTLPPFAPPASTALEAPQYADNFEHRWAGLRAHNRWMLEMVSQAPERCAGIAQIFLGDVEGSVAEIEWAAENGLRGGILLPGAPPARRSSRSTPRRTNRSGPRPRPTACRSTTMRAGPPRRSETTSRRRWRCSSSRCAGGRSGPCGT